MVWFTVILQSTQTPSGPSCTPGAVRALLSSCPRAASAEAPEGWGLSASPASKPQGWGVTASLSHSGDQAHSSLNPVGKSCFADLEVGAQRS